MRWYLGLIVSPHAATHSIAACHERQRTPLGGCTLHRATEAVSERETVRLSVINASVFMLADWSRCVGRCWSVVSEALAGLWAVNDVRNNRGYVIAVYVISNRRPILKNRKLTGP